MLSGIIQKQVAALDEDVTRLSKRITDADIKHGQISELFRQARTSVEKIQKHTSKIVELDLEEKKNSKQIHWHIEIYPQITPWSGLERGFGIFLNELSPEKVAHELGNACRKELSLLVGIS